MQYTYTISPSLELIKCFLVLGVYVANFVVFIFQGYGHHFSKNRNYCY